MGLWNFPSLLGPLQGGFWLPRKFAFDVDLLLFDGFPLINLDVNWYDLMERTPDALVQLDL